MSIAEILRTRGNLYSHDLLFFERAAQNQLHEEMRRRGLVAGGAKGGTKMKVASVAMVCFALIGPALAQEQTVKACRAEWQAHKAENQAKGITEKAFIDQCRGAEVPATTPTATKPAPTAVTPAAAPKPAAPAIKPAPAATASPGGANQFAMEVLAKAHCPSDTVVWANLKSKVYHFSGHKDFGNTKEGAYMCEKDATGQGIRAAKNEKHPA
jgi:hypothetical protein